MEKLFLRLYEQIPAFACMLLSTIVHPHHTLFDSIICEYPYVYILMKDFNSA